MLEQERSVNVSAEDGSRAAGRDYHEAPERIVANHGGNAAGRDLHQNQFNIHRNDRVKPPRWDSPDLRDCPHCGTPWVSRLAMFCPTCCYSLQLARQEEQRETALRWQLTLVPLGLLCFALWGTPALDAAAASPHASYRVLYALGNLLQIMTGVLVVAAGWFWWRYWRSKREGV